MNTGRGTQEMAADYGVSLPDGQDHMSLTQQWAAFWENRHLASEVVLKETLDKLASANAALLMLANACDDVGVKHFDTDTLSPEVEAMQSATAVARSVLSKTL